MKHTQLETREDKSRKALFMLIITALGLVLMAFSYITL